MATLPRLFPVGDGASTTMAAPVGSSTYWDAVNDGDTHDNDTTHITGGLDSTGTQDLLLTDMPADFASLDSITATVYGRLNGTRNDDTTALYAQIVTSTGTALTSEILVGQNSGSTNDWAATYAARTVTFTGLADTANKAAWDDARLRLRWAFTKNKSSDGISIRVTSAYVDGAYLPTGPPSSPTLSIAGTTFSSVTLEWTATGSTYDIYQSPDGAAWTLVVPDATGTSHKVIDLVPETLYYFYIVAKNSSGTATSNTVSTTTPVKPDAVLDSFNRPASSSLGTTDTGETWVASSGWYINANGQAEAMLADQTATVEVGDNNQRVSITPGTRSNLVRWTLVARSVDDAQTTCFRVYGYDLNGLRIERVVNGVVTNLGTIAVPSLGTRISIEVNGTQVSTYHDDVLVFGPVEGGSDHVGTKAGFAKGVYADYAGLMDDFEATLLSAPTGPATVTGTSTAGAASSTTALSTVVVPAATVTGTSTASAVSTTSSAASPVTVSGSTSASAQTTSSATATAFLPSVNVTGTSTANATSASTGTALVRTGGTGTATAVSTTSSASSPVTVSASTTASGLTSTSATATAFLPSVNVTGSATAAATSASSAASRNSTSGSTAAAGVTGAQASSRVLTGASTTASATSGASVVSTVSTPTVGGEIPPPALRLRASDLTGLVDGDGVGTWADTSGNGYDYSQATVDARPTYRANVLNGRPVVVFDGVNDALMGNVAAHSVLTNAAGITVFAVYYQPVGQDGTDRIYCETRNGSLTSSRFTFAVDSAQDTRLGGVRVEADTYVEEDYPNTPTGSWSVLSGHIDYPTGDLQAWLNGTPRTPVGERVYSSTGETGSTLPAETTSIGSRNGGDNINGSIAEFIMYRRALTADERAQVHSYFQDEYGITVSDYVVSTPTVTGTSTASAVSSTSSASSPVTVTGTSTASATSTSTAATTVTTSGSSTATASSATSAAPRNSTTGSSTASGATGAQAASHVRTDAAGTASGVSGTSASASVRTSASSTAPATSTATASSAVTTSASGSASALSATSATGNAFYPSVNVTGRAQGIAQSATSAAATVRTSASGSASATSASTAASRNSTTGSSAASATTTTTAASQARTGASSTASAISGASATAAPQTTTASTTSSATSGTAGRSRVLGDGNSATASAASGASASAQVRTTSSSTASAATSTSSTSAVRIHAATTSTALSGATASATAFYPSVNVTGSSRAVALSGATAAASVRVKAATAASSNSTTASTASVRVSGACYAQATSESRVWVTYITVHGRIVATALSTATGLSKVYDPSGFRDIEIVVGAPTAGSTTLGEPHLSYGTGAVSAGGTEAKEPLLTSTSASTPTTSWATGPPTI